MCLSRFLAVGLLLLGISASPPATPLAREAHSVTGDAGGQVVSDWGALASQLATATRMPPFRTPVTFALVHLAMYDAVNAVAGGYKPYASSPRVALPASGVAAAVGAAYTILLTEFPTEQVSLDAARAASLAGVPDDGASLTNGLTTGIAAARDLLALRADDGRNATVKYTPGSGPGVWVPTPSDFAPAGAPFLARVRPFTMNAPWQFRPAGPPRFKSREWTEDYNEVKALGSKDSATRTPEQTATGVFWTPLAGTVWPASIRRVVAERKLDLATSARFQAAAFAAFADGLIGCWDAKYHFNFWRPITAIRDGDADGNGKTEADAAWEPLAVTPSFPDYPSGHTCATTAVAYVMQDFFPCDLRIPARNVSGEERVYERAQDVVDEVIEARMLIGVHYRFANEDGAKIGYRIARRIHNRFFKPRAG